MILQNRRYVALFIACLSCLLATSAIADEPEIYESIDDLDIGPVFLTQTQRDNLDEQRLRPRSETSEPFQNSEVKKSSSTVTSSAVKRAAGYIISSRGSRHEWSGSDFVVMQESAYTMQNFPGDVTVQRHEPADDANDGDGGEDDN